MFRKSSGRVLLALAFAAAAVPALAADYQTNLGPMPLDDETKLVIGGRGDGRDRQRQKRFGYHVASSLEVQLPPAPACSGWYQCRLSGRGI